MLRIWEKIVHTEIAKLTREKQDALHLNNKLKFHQY